MDERSKIRWQHRLKREHPTGTERTKIAQSRVRMEGWRQWRLGRRKNRVQRQNKKTHLTRTGLLMEGDFTRDPINSRNRDEAVGGFIRRARGLAGVQSAPHVLQNYWPHLGC